MDKTARVFDRWATAGRSEEMEDGHGVTVGKFLGRISFGKPFSQAEKEFFNSMLPIRIEFIYP